MTDAEFVLSRDQRDQIMKAVEAIGRQVKDMVTKPENMQMASYVIFHNLTIVHMSLVDLPDASSN